MVAKSNLDLTMRIAPKRACGDWTVKDWQDASQADDWQTMIRIFKDRFYFRFLAAGKALLQADGQYSSPSVGFALIALDCLLIETLNQFYRNKKATIAARGKPSIVRTSSSYRRAINQLGPDGWYYASFFTDVSHYFRPYFLHEPKAAVIFYEDFRCGILHSAETVRKSLIRVKDYSNPVAPFQIIIEKVAVSMENPSGDYEAGMILYRNRFHELLIKEFAYYCHQLRDIRNQQLRARFKEKMDKITRLKENDE